MSHRTIKAGFECAHAPSIDLASVAFSPRPEHPPSNPFSGTTSAGPPESPTLSRRRSSARRSGFMGLPRSPFSKDRDLDKEASQQTGDASQSSLQGATTATGAQNAGGAGARAQTTTSSSSFTMLQVPPANSAGGLAPIHPGGVGTGMDYASDVDNPSSNSRAGAGSGVHSGQAVMDVNAPQEAADMVVRFEIFIIKVPWLPGLHGIQFRRISGSAWQYSQLGEFERGLVGLKYLHFLNKAHMLIGFPSNGDQILPRCQKLERSSTNSTSEVLLLQIEICIDPLLCSVQRNLRCCSFAFSALQTAASCYFLRGFPLSSAFSRPPGPFPPACFFPSSSRLALRDVLQWHPCECPPRYTNCIKCAFRSSCGETTRSDNEAMLYTTVLLFIRRMQATSTKKSCCTSIPIVSNLVVRWELQSKRSSARGGDLLQ